MADPPTVGSVMLETFSLIGTAAEVGAKALEDNKQSQCSPGLPSVMGIIGAAKKLRSASSTEEGESKGMPFGSGTSMWARASETALFARPGKLDTVVESSAEASETSPSSCGEYTQADQKIHGMTHPAEEPEESGPSLSEWSTLETAAASAISPQVMPSLEPNMTASSVLVFKPTAVARALGERKS